MGAWKAIRKLRGGRPPGQPWPAAEPRPPVREDFRQENERLRKENERLRERVAESDQQIADHDRQIADRDRQIADHDRQIADRDRQIADHDKQIADRDKQIADLERQLAGRKKDSTNSSKPPSSDGPAAARRLKPSRCRGRRKPGGQKGHPGRHRELQPLERVDEIVAVLPPDCRHCRQALPQQIEQAETRGEVHRYQVTELPPLRAHITEYQCHKVACPHCGRATRAELPAEVRVSAFGPRPGCPLGRAPRPA